jgi:hypothetical protein
MLNSNKSALILKSIWTNFQKSLLDILHMTYLVKSIIIEPYPHGFLVTLIQFLELLEFLGALSVHDWITEFARELDVEGPGQVGDLRGQHISGDHRRMNFVTLLTSLSSWLVLHLLPALWAAVVDHFVIIVDSLDKATDHVELSLLLDRLPVAVPGGLLQVLIALHGLN